MKTATLILFVFCMVSIASPLLSPRQATVPPSVPMRLHPNLEVAPLQYVTLAWEPNYDSDDEVTVIVATTDLTMPVNQWSPCFSGHTNTCRLPMFYDRQFFTAYNMQP